MRMKIAAAAVWALVLAGLGCFAGLPDRNLQRRVAEAEIVGTWRLTPASLAMLKRDGYAGGAGQDHTITFEADNTVRFASVLDNFRGGLYTTADGSWKLERDNTSNSNVKKANALRLELKPEPAQNTILYLNFDEHNGDLVLWSFYGDPDSWEFIEYVKDDQAEDATESVPSP